MDDWSDNPLWGASSDDDAVFEAALRLIDTADPPNDDASNSSFEDAGCGSLHVHVKLPTRAAAEKKQATALRKRGRPKACVMGATRAQRRNLTKEEIAQLRPLVSQLETQLAALQSRRGHHDSIETNGDRKRVRRDAWKAMAERQLVQRRRVESEKQSLIELLAEQTATLHKLQHIFTAHENRVRAASYEGTAMRSQPLSASIFTSDPASLETLQPLTFALGRMHLHTDAILADARFLSPESSCVEIKTEHSLVADSGCLAVQLMDTRVVPFSMARTANAVWRNLLNRANQKQVEPFTTDMVQSQFVTHVPGFQGRVEAAMALQRVVEPSRVVMVRCSVFVYKDTVENPGAIAGGPPMTLHHFLWTAVSRFDGAEDECRIQTCFISVPNLHGDARHQTAAITKLCADVSKCFNADAHDDVDNILLSGGRIDTSAVHAAT